MPADPIRGRWTIHHTSGTQTQTLRVLNALVDGPPIAAMSDAVEVVPVPDEAAIERGAEALREACGATSTLRTYRKLALVVLRAALETPTPPTLPKAHHGQEDTCQKTRSPASSPAPAATAPTSGSRPPHPPT